MKKVSYAKELTIEAANYEELLKNTEELGALRSRVYQMLHKIESAIDTFRDKQPRHKSVIFTKNPPRAK